MEEISEIENLLSENYDKIMKKTFLSYVDRFFSTKAKEFEFFCFNPLLKSYRLRMASLLLRNVWKKNETTLSNLGGLKENGQINYNHQNNFGTLLAFSSKGKNIDVEKTAEIFEHILLMVSSNMVSATSIMSLEQENLTKRLDEQLDAFFNETYKFKENKDKWFYVLEFIENKELEIKKILEVNNYLRDEMWPVLEIIKLKHPDFELYNLENTLNADFAGWFFKKLFEKNNNQTTKDIVAKYINLTANNEENEIFDIKKIMICHASINEYSIDKIRDNLLNDLMDNIEIFKKDFNEKEILNAIKLILEASSDESKYFLTRKEKQVKVCISLYEQLYKDINTIEELKSLTNENDVLNAKLIDQNLTLKPFNLKVYLFNNYLKNNADRFFNTISSKEEFCLRIKAYKSIVETRYPLLTKENVLLDNLALSIKSDDLYSEIAIVSSEKIQLPKEYIFEVLEHACEDFQKNKNKSVFEKAIHSILLKNSLIYHNNTKLQKGIAKI